jgi:hypothetical protein
MKRFAIGLGLMFAVSRVAMGDGDTNVFPTLVTKRGTFTNATVRSVTNGYAIVVYEGGGQRIPISELPVELRKRYATNSIRDDFSAEPPPKMSPAEFFEWQKRNAPEMLLQKVNSEISVTQSQIALLQQKAAELSVFAANSQMPTRLSTLTPVTADMLLSSGAPRQGRSALQAYSDKLRDLQSLKQQLEQVVLNRQRAQP